jgi:hypothetical protein
MLNGPAVGQIDRAVDLSGDAAHSDGPSHHPPAERNRACAEITVR